MNGAGSAYARPEQPEEVLAAARRVARELQRREEQRRQDPVAGHRSGRRRLLELGQQREAALVHRVEPAREHCLEQLFLAAEVVVHRGRG